jgi:hypothetical protein
MLQSYALTLYLFFHFNFFMLPVEKVTQFDFLN